MKNIELAASQVEKIIEDEFNNLTKQDFETFFDKFQSDSRTLSFIKYYNETVLDKTKISFKEFRHQWALHFTTPFYVYFDANYNTIINEIRKKKNIRDFHDKFCTDRSGKIERKQGSFCSKLFHTVLPLEFPPIDNPIRKKFNLQKEDFIMSVLIIKRGYELYIKDNSKIINLIRTILLKNKFSYLRINELSNIRILDMYYWFKENRELKLS